LKNSIYDQEKNRAKRAVRMMATAGSLAVDLLEQGRKGCHHGCRSTRVSRGSKRIGDEKCSYLSI